MASRARPRKTSFFSRQLTSVVLCLAPLLSGCEECSPRTGVQQLRQELSRSCSLQENGIIRATKNNSSSTQPDITDVGDGHLLAWIDDRELPPAIYLQKINPLGTPIGEQVRVETRPNPHRPKLASSGREIVLLYSIVDEPRPAEPRPTADGGADETTDGGAGEMTDGGVPDSSGAKLIKAAANAGGPRMTTLELQVLSLKLRPLLAEPRSLGETDTSHGAGITYHEGQYVVAVAREGALHLTEISTSTKTSSQVTDGGGDGDAAPDAGPPSEQASLNVRQKSVALADDVHEPGNVDLLFHGGKLYVAADHPEGWSIQISEVGRDQVRSFAQVVDDRRHPDSRWCCPALGPVGESNIVTLWQGPSNGLASLLLLEFDEEGDTVGIEQTFEAMIRDEDGHNLGRAPAFHPALAPAPYGVIAAFADNRFANTEILLATFACGATP